MLITGMGIGAIKTEKKTDLPAKSLLTQCAISNNLEGVPVYPGSILLVSHIFMIMI